MRLTPWEKGMGGLGMFVECSVLRTDRVTNGGSLCNDSLIDEAIFNWANRRWVRVGGSHHMCQMRQP